MHCNDSHVYTVNVKYSFAALINQQKCNIHIFINARKKDKFGSVL